MDGVDMLSRGSRRTGLGSWVYEDRSRRVLRRHDLQRTEDPRGLPERPKASPGLVSGHWLRRNIHDNRPLSNGYEKSDHCANYGVDRRAPKSFRKYPRFASALSFTAALAFRVGGDERCARPCLARPDLLTPFSCLWITWRRRMTGLQDFRGASEGISVSRVTAEVVSSWPQPIESHLLKSSWSSSTVRRCGR